MRSWSSRAWVRGVVLWVALGLVLSGCATGPAPPRAITLAGVVVDAQRLARADERGLVRVLRQGAWLDGHAEMTLQAGDLVQTAGNAYALIRYPSGTELYMRPASRGRIGSFTDMLGEIFVKIRGAFAVQTNFVRAGAEGTAYLVRAAPGGEATVVVFDGAVNLSSLTGAWPAMRLGSGTMSVTALHSAPTAMPVPSEELAHTRGWVERLERLVPAPRTGSGAGVGAALAIAGLVALIAASRSDDKDRASLPAPAGATPGSGSARDPARLSACRSLMLSWRPVDGANDYVVKLESASPSDPNAWRPAATLTAPATRIAAGERLGGGAVHRWSVQARDAKGQAGAASPWLYLTCGGGIYR